MTDNQNLLPCPFCGGEARRQTDKGRSGKVCVSQYFRQYVHCKNKKCYVMTKVFKRPGLATEAWNTRSAPQPSPEWIPTHLSLQKHGDSIHTKIYNHQELLSKVEEKKQEFPTGAIENGRAFADQVESIYSFKDENGHDLSTCHEWQEFRRCFEYMSDFIYTSQSVIQSSDTDKLYKVRS